MVRTARFALRWAAPALAVAALSTAPASAQQGAPVNIDRNGVLILIRSTLLALDDANKTGNYTVLRDMGAPRFQANTAARLGEIFLPQRRDGLDLSAVAVLEPQLSVLPQTDGNGVMHIAGFFPSAPAQVNFDLSYAPIGGKWRIFSLSVQIGSASPAAPEAAPAPAAAPPAAAAPAPVAAIKPPANPVRPKPALKPVPAPRPEAAPAPQPPADPQ